ncbi:MAG: hypothetical protein U9Q84_03945, partial [Thermodesulfobacteriota bacterium]|nr:hypothetical protein [Thermodesulfobacteriota bacterium]
MKGKILNFSYLTTTGFLSNSFSDFWKKRAAQYLTAHPASMHCLNQLIEFAMDADGLITDCTYTDKEYESKIGWGHSSISQVVDLAHRAGVKTLHLFHHDLSQTDTDIDAKLETAQAMLKEKGSSTICIAPKER